MLSAIVSPAGYSTHFLSLSLYLLVAVLAGGYAVAVLVAGMLDRYDESTDAAILQSGTVAALSRWRWFWIPSLYVLALLFVFLITHGQQAGAGQLMYRQF